MKRREFVINSTVMGLGSLAVAKCRAQDMTGLKDIGLQLYTVRDEMEKDPIATLKTIAEIGYSHVENAGYYEGKFYKMEASEFKKVLEDLGLKMYSGHTMTGAHNPLQMRTMTNGWEMACEDAAYLGQKHIVCAYLIDKERKDIDDYKRLAELFNKSGEIAKSFGLNFAFHNHDFEFIKMGDTVPYDIFMEETDPNLVNYELDLYWTRKAGVEALDYFEKYPGRFKLWHVKDMEEGEEKRFAEVGQGVIDWKKYFAKATQSGMQHFYVEQDMCYNHKPLESVKISHKYLSDFSI